MFPVLDVDWLFGSNRGTTAELAHIFVTSIIIIIASRQWNFLSSGTSQSAEVQGQSRHDIKKEIFGTYNRKYLLGPKGKKSRKLRRKREHLSFLLFVFQSIVSESFRCAHSVCCSSNNRGGNLVRV